MERKDDKSCLPKKNWDCSITLFILIVLWTHQTLLFWRVNGALLLITLYSYHLSLAENLALKSASIFSVDKIATGWGRKWWLSPSRIVSVSIKFSNSKLATWPFAWTPASVLPAPKIEVFLFESFWIDSSINCWIERPFSWRCHPTKFVPSYSMVIL